MASAAETRRTPIQRAHRSLLAVLGLLFLVLLVTGVWLAFRYQPSGSFAAARPEGTLRVVHRVTSSVFLLAAVATFGLSIAVSFERALRRGTPAWVVGVVLAVGAVAAGITGYLLPWEELALAPVSPGEFRGFGFLFGSSNVRFVLIGSTEVATATIRTWFLVHTIAIPLGLVGLGVSGWRVTRRARVSPPPTGEAASA
ncbi:MAG: hypothetical protein JO265_08060 [Acidimicrobiia bacterium]|nr:hypothetical protein [Acidimicrobiia bacterium]